MRDTGIAGRVAVVTGAAGGIGAAIVRALHDEGARVAALDVDADGVAALVAAVSTPALPARAEVVDVRRPAEIDAALTRIEAEWGPIDIGVNVAGILSTTTIVETDEESWRNVFAVNAEGVFSLSRGSPGA
jgi:2,3-dihydro-2,3-dihydroxybenzoate dehydrogenase